MMNNQIVKMFSLLIFTNQLCAPAYNPTLNGQYEQVTFDVHKLYNIELGTRLSIIIVFLGAYITSITAVVILLQIVKTFGLFRLFVILSAAASFKFGALVGRALRSKIDEFAEEIEQLKLRLSILESSEQSTSQNHQADTNYSWLGVA